MIINTIIYKFEINYSQIEDLKSINKFTIKYYVIKKWFWIIKNISCKLRIIDII